jgi:hypothetical protein
MRECGFAYYIVAQEGARVAEVKNARATDYPVNCNVIFFKKKRNSDDA